MRLFRRDGLSLFFVVAAAVGSMALIASPAAALASTKTKLVLVTSAGPIGTLDVDERASAGGGGTDVDADFRVDDNGRGSKLKEHMQLDKGGLPVKWDVEGKAWYGAPVKESFVVEGAGADRKAKWTSLDDNGSADGKDALYIANNGTPWALQVFVRVLLASKNNTHAAVPGGTLRLEKLHDVDVGADQSKSKEKLTAYALWGIDVSPQFLLVRKDRLVASISPGWVLTEEKHVADFDALSRLAGELSAEALRALNTRLTHSVDGPLWITNVHVFDAASGKVSADAMNVGVFRDRIVSVGNEPAPDDATVVDGGGGTILPSLFDSHDHLSDWAGPLHIAAGVLLGRDPGNDNESLLALEKRIDGGELMGPRMKNSGFLEGKSPFSAHMGFVVDTVDDAKKSVHWYADHGYWGIKIYNSMNPDFVKPIAEEAHKLGLHVSGHVPAFMSSERAINDGYDEVNHINQLMLMFVIDATKEDTRTPFRFTAIGERMAKLDLKSAPVQRVIKLMKDKHITLDPTLATFSPLLQGRPGMTCPADATWLDHMPIAVQRGRRTAVLDIKPEQYATYDASWKKLEETLRLLYAEGINLVPGTDDYAGLVLHAELESWVRAGIPAPAVLSMATLGGARFLGVDAVSGTVANGKLADLYLVDGDPTKDISAIRKGRLVVRGGKVYYPDDVFTALGVKPFAAHVTMQPPKQPAPR